MVDESVGVSHAILSEDELFELLRRNAAKTIYDAASDGRVILSQSASDDMRALARSHEALRARLEKLEASVKVAAMALTRAAWEATCDKALGGKL